MNKQNKNTEGLREHTEKLKTETERKVEQAIDYILETEGMILNFQNVSKISGISRTTLYNNMKIRSQIMGLRKKESEAGTSEEQNKKIKDLQKRITELEKQNRLLIEQLVEMDELRQENEKLKKYLNNRA